MGHSGSKRIVATNRNFFTQDLRTSFSYYLNRMTAIG